MDDTSRSSFIPKQGAGMIPTTVRKRKRFYVFGFVGTVVLVGSLLLAVGTYFYRGTVESKLAAEQAALSEKKEAFSEAQILEVRQFERKLAAVRYLLNNHIAPSKVFEALHLTTLSPVQLTAFSLEQRPSQDVTLSVSANTDAFRVVALQALALGENALLKNAIVSDLTKQDVVSIGGTDSNSSDAMVLLGNSLNFTIVGNIDAELLAYDGKQSSALVNPGGSGDSKTADQ